MAGYPEATPILKYNIFDFSGGLNTADNDMSLQNNELSDVENVVFSERGLIKKRAGLKITSNYPSKSGIQVLKIDRFFKRDLRNFRLVFFDDGMITVNGPNGIEQMTIKDEFDADYYLLGKKIASFTYNNKYYFGNATDGWFKFEDYETVYPSQVCIARKVVGIPKCDMAIVFNSRAFYSGDSIQLDRLYFSELNNPESVDEVVVEANDETEDTVGGFYDIQSGGHVQITGLAVFMNSLVIFKRDSAFALTGATPTSHEIKPVNVATGCIAPESVVSADNAVYYLGKNGVYSIYNAFETFISTKPVSEKISPTIEKRLNKEDAKGVYSNGKYYLIFEDKVLLYDEYTTSWTKFSLQLTACFHDLEIQSVVMGNSRGYAYTFEEGQLKDEVTPGVYEPIIASFSTSYFSLEDPASTKRFKFAKIFFHPVEKENSQIDIKIEVDYKEIYKSFLSTYNFMKWGDKWGQLWGPMKDQMSQLVRFGGSGSYVRFNFSNGNVDEDLSITGITIGYKKKRKIR